MATTKMITTVTSFTTVGNNDNDIYWISMTQYV